METPKPQAVDEKILTAKEKKELLALGKAFKKLNQQQKDLLVQAREIIGFQNTDIEDFSAYDGAFAELKEALSESLEEEEDIATVFIKYAEISKTRWNAQVALEAAKKAMNRLNINPEQINWEDCTLPIPGEE
jgi:hypothetical protein